MNVFSCISLCVLLQRGKRPKLIQVKTAMFQEDSIMKICSDKMVAMCRKNNSNDKQRQVHGGVSINHHEDRREHLKALKLKQGLMRDGENCRLRMQVVIVNESVDDYQKGSAAVLGLVEFVPLCKGKGSQLEWSASNLVSFDH